MEISRYLQCRSRDLKTIQSTTKMQSLTINLFHTMKRISSQGENISSQDDRYIKFFIYMK